MSIPTDPLILVADDDVDDVQLIEKAIKRSQHSHRLQLSKNGVELMQALRQGLRPDLLLLDLNMPKLNGFEVLQQMDQIGLLPGIKVVVFSTSIQASDRERCLHHGAQRFLSKPQSFSDYCSVLQELLDEYLDKDSAEVQT